MEPMNYECSVYMKFEDGTVSVVPYSGSIIAEDVESALDIAEDVVSGRVYALGFADLHSRIAAFEVWDIRLSAVPSVAPETLEN